VDATEKPDEQEDAMEVHTLQDVLKDELADLYSAEQELVVALPKMAEAAHSDKLREAFEHHLDETHEQVRRLEKAMKAIAFALPPRAVSPGMRGLLDAGEEVIEARGEPAALDAALIAAAQRVEHYEIAGYGTARALARELGFGNVRSLLSDTLAEEGNADRTLTKLALGGLVSSGINEAATTR
jgi:ferritin-like metal-binding protein YciE